MRAEHRGHTRGEQIHAGVVSGLADGELAPREPRPGTLARTAARDRVVAARRRRARRARRARRRAAEDDRAAGRRARRRRRAGGTPPSPPPSRGRCRRPAPAEHGVRPEPGARREPVARSRAARSARSPCTPSGTGSTAAPAKCSSRRVNARIGVHQERVEVALEPVEHAALEARAPTASYRVGGTTSRSEQTTCTRRVGVARRRDERERLGLELPLAQRVVLDRHHVGGVRARGGGQALDALVQDLGRGSRVVQRLQRAGAAADARQVARRRGPWGRRAAAPAARRRRGAPGAPGEPARDRVHAHEVADAGEVLRVAEDAHDYAGAGRAARRCGRGSGCSGRGSSRCASARKRVAVAVLVALLRQLDHCVLRGVAHDARAGRRRRPRTSSCSKSSRR